MPMQEPLFTAGLAEFRGYAIAEMNTKVAIFKYFILSD